MLHAIRRLKPGRGIDQAKRPSVKPARRWRPDGLLALEGRALMAASVIDPSFNGGQALVTPAGLTDPISENTDEAVAVQADGKLVVVGQAASLTNASGDALQVSVQRYNPDGTLDATFGTSGQTLVAVLKGAANDLRFAHQVVIQPDGAIVLDVNTQTSTYEQILRRTTITPVGSAVIRLTAAGALDSGFGTGGVVSLTANTPLFTGLALQTDGKILLDGIAVGTGSAANAPSQLVVTRLNADGSADASFNGGSLRFIDAITPVGSPTLLPRVAAGIGLTTGGKIKLVTAFAAPTGETTSARVGVVQLNTDGTLDATYGAGGVSTLPDAQFIDLAAATVLSDGQVVLGINNVSNLAKTSNVSRLNADGTVDAAFGTKSYPFTLTSLAAATDGSLAIGGQGRTSFETGWAFVSLTVARLDASGQRDTSFGPGGFVAVATPNALPIGQAFFPSAGASAAGLAFTADGRIVVAGSATYGASGIGQFPVPSSFGSQAILGILRSSNRLSGLNGDYDGDNRSDIAAELATLGVFAYRKSTGGDVLQNFGALGAGQTLPAPGDYDGDGLADVAAFLPAYGVLAYRPSSGGADVLTRLGPIGLGRGIPAPGDYDGDGKTDPAVFDTETATYTIQPSGGAAPLTIQFGAAGAGQTIPVPGDFDGNGATDLAVYIPSLGQLFYRGANATPSTSGDNSITFGPAGQGASIPLAGDYNDDGITDFAVFIPSTGTFAIYPSNVIPAYAVQFGPAGPGYAEPITGDFDGDGRTDLAVSIPLLDRFAFRPSGGGADVLQQFGTGGTTTVPATALPGNALSGLVSSRALEASDPAAGLVFFLPDDATTGRKKPLG